MGAASTEISVVDRPQVPHVELAVRRREIATGVDAPTPPPEQVEPADASSIQRAQSSYSNLTRMARYSIPHGAFTKAPSAADLGLLHRDPTSLALRRESVTKSLANSYAFSLRNLENIMLKDYHKRKNMRDQSCQTHGADD